MGLNLDQKVFAKVVNRIRTLKQKDPQYQPIISLVWPACEEFDQSLSSEEMLVVLEFINSTLKELTSNSNYTIYLHFRSPESEKSWRAKPENQKLLNSPLLADHVFTIDEFRNTEDWKNAEELLNNFLQNNPKQVNVFENACKTDAEKFLDWQKRTGKNIDLNGESLIQYFKKAAIDRIRWMPSRDAGKENINIYFSHHHDDTLQVFKFINKHIEKIRGKSNGCMINTTFIRDKFPTLDEKQEDGDKENCDEEDLELIAKAISRFFERGKVTLSLQMYNIASRKLAEQQKTTPKSKPSLESDAQKFSFNKALPGTVMYASNQLPPDEITNSNVTTILVKKRVKVT